MWYLNYCSPFLFNAGTQAMAYRYVMYSQICALFLIYVIFTVAYRFFSKEETEKQKFAKQHQNTRLTGNRLNCSNNQDWVSSKTFKQWYLSYFSMHAVAVGTCIFYSPFLPQMIFTVAHLALWIAACILFQFRRKQNKVFQWFYKIIMVLVCILNVMLLFSGSMGVGASGYDQNAKICLLQSAPAPSRSRL